MQPKIGLTFASALRAFLRQDPDVIMVGEIRDKETAEIAIHASLTGHLVLSTIHTNDAAGAVTRLVDMGIEPFLVRSSVIGILAQRLVRVLCPHCKEPYKPTRLRARSSSASTPSASRRRDAARALDRATRCTASTYEPVGWRDPGMPDVLHAPSGCDQCVQQGLHRAGAASTSSWSSTTPSARSS